MPKARPGSRTVQAGILVLVGLLFGGGGSGAGLANLVVQLAGLAILAINGPAVAAFFRTAPRGLVVLVALTLLLPLLQLVPLPPAIWQALPGREFVGQSLDLTGGSDVWMPFSLDPNRTAIAFFALLPALAILVLAWQLGREDKRQLLMLVVACGLIVVLLGAQQLATGNRHLVFYAETIGSPDLQGTFANRNTGGLMLDIALVALVAVFPLRQIRAIWTLGGMATAVLLIVGVVLTRSRTSMLLLLVPAALAAWRWVRWRRPTLTRRTAIAVGAVVLVLAGAASLLANNQRVQSAFGRFDAVEDEQRPLIWKDTVAASRRYWPVGSGIGSFDDVFQADEALENLSYGRAQRAHDDFLEATLESGLVGIALVLGWAFVLGRLGVAALRRGGIGLAGVGTFALVALQSITDYPLRSQTLLCLFALMAALLIGAERDEAESRRGAPEQGGKKGARSRPAGRSGSRGTGGRGGRSGQEDGLTAFAPSERVS
ncbi:O-antigen ligase family protein [Novosphingobium sp. PhB55]|uniref:O-antigen ligase family protein n=1 Tax=Novosphingobium sp. PhB55 TaxID=2485106 RepID=UPI001066CE54|nr:O-antigen ligase family protein [Novosphingobium sp. PhB55]